MVKCIRTCNRKQHEFKRKKDKVWIIMEITLIECCTLHNLFLNVNEKKAERRKRKIIKYTPYTNVTFYSYSSLVLLRNFFLFYAGNTCNFCVETYFLKFALFVPAFLPGKRNINNLTSALLLCFVMFRNMSIYFIQ